MKINENFYGLKNTWVDFNIDSNQKTDKIKLANFSGGETTQQPQYLYNGVLNGVFDNTINKLDNSAAIFNINSQAAICKTQIFAPYINGEWEDYQLFDLYDKYMSMPIIPMIAGVQYSIQNYINLDVPFTAVKQNATSYNRYYTNSIITEFDYNSLVMLCYVRCCSISYVDSDNYSVAELHTVLLDDYYNENYTYNYKKYPYIASLHMTPYYTINKTDDKHFRKNIAFAYFTSYKPKTYNYDGSKLNYSTFFPNSFNNGNITNVGNNMITVLGVNYTQGVLSSSYIDTTGESTLIKLLTESYTLPYLINNPDYKPDIKTKNTNNQYVYHMCYLLKKEEVYREFAYQGFWFTGSAASINNVTGVNCTDEKLHIPVFNNYTTTGNYKSGVAAAKEPNASWSDLHNENYEPKIEEDNRIKSNISIADADVEYKGIYNMSLDTLSKFKSALFSSDENIAFSEYIDYVYMIPFTIPDRGVTAPITLNGHTFSYQGSVITANVMTMFHKIFTVQKFVDSFYNDFRDFAPYSTYTIHIPFMGDYSIDPNLFLNKLLTFELYLHLPSGSAVFFIIANDSVIYKFSDNVSSSLSLSITDNYLYNIAKKQKGINFVSDVISSVLSVALLATSKKKLVTTLLAGEKITSLFNYTSEIQAPSPQTVSNSTDASSLIDDTICKITRISLKNNNYVNVSNNIGNATKLTGFLKDFSGFVVIENINVNANLPPTIIDIIKNILKGGIYL